MSDKKYYITTPIYYVNDVPHIGHAYTTIAADVLARFYRLYGYDVLFMTGTDEHGQKIERAAEKAGMTPQEFVNMNSQVFRDLDKHINSSSDMFMRTSSEEHKISAQALWNKLYDNGQIYESKYCGWYSIRDEAFFAESELVDGKAPTGAEVEWVEEPSYFFKLSQWQEPLLKYYQENPEFIGPDSRRNEVMSFVKSGLRDLSISRSTFKWGIPVPQNPEHVMYVWIEALSIYITALGHPNVDSDKFKQFWPTCVQLMGKDIIRFHGVYWPAFLMAAGYPLPKKEFAHGWWTIEGEKMSKSIGNVVDPIALTNKYGVDPVRYFLMREVPFGKDGDFSIHSFINRVNSDLANDLGNLSQRVLSFVYKNCEAKIPAHGIFTEADNELLNMAKALNKTIFDLMEKQEISKICEAIWAVIGESNRYIDTQQPWSLRKTDQERMQTVLYVLMEALRYIAILTQPIMPDSATKILEQLAIPFAQRVIDSIDENILKPETVLPQPEGVFPRIQLECI